MRISLAVVLVGALVGVGAGCSPDPPSHEAAVAKIADVCADKATEMASIGLPTDVFALSAVAGQAFAMASRGIAELDSEGLAAMDDATIQAYLRAATAMNNALSALSGRAGFEDVAGMEAAMADGDVAGADLDTAAEELGLDPACGGPAWRGRVLDDARTVVGLERGLMTPTGGYVTDVSTYCARFERRLGLAPQPTTLDDARRRAFVIRSAAEQFGTRLGPLSPPSDLADTDFALVSDLAEVVNLLEPAETLAVDGDEAPLQDLVRNADEILGLIDGKLTLIGADC